MQLLTALVVVGLASHSLAITIGSTCSGDGDCNGAIKNSYCMKYGPCTKGMCWCSSGYTNNVDYTQCTPIGGSTPINYKKIGDTCTSSTDCTGYSTGATCTNGKCTCVNKANAADGIFCQPYSNGDACAITAQCGYTSYGTCSSGKCACQSGYKWVTSGDIPAPGGCFANSVVANMGTNAAGCSTSWSANMGSASLQFCGSGLMCATCPAGDTYTNTFCSSAASSLAVAMVTIVLAALVNLLL